MRKNKNICLHCGKIGTIDHRGRKICQERKDELDQRNRERQAKSRENNPTKHKEMWKKWYDENGVEYFRNYRSIK